jgi:hypothetical protein
MDITRMLYCLTKGKKIRSDDWLPGKYIYLKDSKILDEKDNAIAIISLACYANYEECDRVFTINEFNLGFRFRYADSSESTAYEVYYKNDEVIVARDLYSLKYITLLKKDFPVWSNYLKSVEE